MTTIATLFIATLNIVTGFLKVQEDAAAQFSALGFPAYETETGAPRFAKIADADILREFLNVRNTITTRSFEAAEWDFDACVPYLGSLDEFGYAPAKVRRRVFSAVYGGSIEGFDLDHICHTDACDDESDDVIHIGDGIYRVIKKEGKVASHENCKHRACINPFHMALATRTENIKRSMGKRYHSGYATHCKRGHEFTLENTRIKRGGRACITCMDEMREAVRSGVHVPKKRSATHCNNGHDREIHTVVGKSQKFCGKCRSDIMVRGYHAKKNSR